MEVEIRREVLDQIYFRTKDAPTANGRQPQAGDLEWDLYFDLDDGRRLHVLMGDRMRRDIQQMILRIQMDDALEDAMDSQASTKEE